MMDWKDYQNISVEDIEQAARGGYWGNLSDSVFPVAINIVGTASAQQTSAFFKFFFFIIILNKTNFLPFHGIPFSRFMCVYAIRFLDDSYDSKDNENGC